MTFSDLLARDEIKVSIAKGNVPQTQSQEASEMKKDWKLSP